MAWTAEPESFSGGRPFDGHPERPVTEDEALLDHHLEEMLRTFGDPVRQRESDLGTEEYGTE